MKRDKIVIYQLLMRLFGNDNANRIANGSLEENGSGKFSDITNQFVTVQKRAGVTHLWLTGVIEHATASSVGGIKGDNPHVVKGVAGSPYAICDYYDVAPYLADDASKRMEEFEAMVVRVHQGGLSVIIDFVPNHLARNYRSDAERGEAFGQRDDTTHAFDAQNNFYYLPNTKFSPSFPLGDYEEMPAKATGNDCFSPSPSVNDWYETVKLNYGVDYCNGGTKHFEPIPDTWFKMRDVLLFWASKGVDGFRCDMAEMVPVEFWHWAITEVKARYADVIFVAEVYNPTLYRSYIYDGGFDYLYDKVGMYDTLRAVVCSQLSASAITRAWQDVNDIQQHMLMFLENHDEQRVASDFFAQSASKAKPAMMVATLLTAAPVMYYFGQEIGERGMDAEGFSGVDGRTTIFDYWSLDKIIRWRNKGLYNTRRLTMEERKLKSWYKELMNIAHERPVAKGSMYDLQYLNYHNDRYDANRQFAWLRRCGNEYMLVVVNFSGERCNVAVNITQEVFDFVEMRATSEQRFVNMFTKEEFAATFSPTEPFEVELPAYDGVVLKFVQK